MNDSASLLEISYRRALLAYPASWRRRNGEEMVGVLLDSAEREHRSMATAQELLALVGSGLAARCERILPRVPAEARDRVSCMSLTIAAALAAIMLVLGELSRWFRFNSYAPGPGMFGPFTTPASLTYLLILAAFTAAVLGSNGGRRILLGLAMISAAAIPLISALTNGIVPVGWPVVAVFIGASVLGLVGEPSHTEKLRCVLTYGAPLGALAFGFTSYLQGGGAQKWFYPGGITMAADTLALAAGCLLLSGLLVFGVVGRWRPLAVLLAIALLPLPIKALFVVYIAAPLWGAIAAACVTAAVFVAWHTRQSQISERKGDL